MLALALLLTVELHHSRAVKRGDYQIESDKENKKDRSYSETNPVVLDYNAAEVRQ